MTDSDWAKDLDKVNISTKIFDDTIETIRTTLDLPTENPFETQRSRLVFAHGIHDGNFLFSPGDQRVWHRRAGKWIEEMGYAAPEASDASSASSGTNEIALAQTELVEALIGHGIFREKDLGLLSIKGDSEVDSCCSSPDASSYFASQSVTCGTPESAVASIEIETSEEDLNAYKESEKRHRKAVENTFDFGYFDWYGNDRETRLPRSSA